MTIEHVLYTGCDVMNKNMREHNGNMSIKHLHQLKYMFSKILWYFSFKYKNETEVRLSRKKISSFSDIAEVGDVSVVINEK